MQKLLKVLGLRVDFIQSERKLIHAVNDVSLELRQGEVLGVLGESGCGKSTIARALLQLLPRNARITEGAVEFEGQNLLGLKDSEMQKLRGSRISMIPQEPGLALNPVLKIGDQIAEVIRAHCDWSWKRCRDDATALLQRLSLAGPNRSFYDAYPHQLSGGQQQRVAIAQALACQPTLVIADEPTASLDSETEIAILQLLRDLKAEHKMALLLITHDAKILPGLADRVAVMYAGRVVEERSVDRVFHEPQHPYTKALLACALPEPGNCGLTPSMRLPTIEGNAPDPTRVPSGCTYAPRCRQRMEVCGKRRPAPTETRDAGRVECFLYGG
jgi:oligopeptide/dipeptide ABC transporter ATP-binding protein